MVVERFPPDIGGSGVRFFEIAQRLSRKHTIDIYTLGEYGAADSTQNFNVYSCDPHRLTLLKLGGFDRVVDLTFSTFFQSLFHSHDLVDVDIWPFIPFLSSKIARPRMPTVISWNVVWPFSFRKTVVGPSTVLARLCSRLSDYNITVSDFARRILLEHVKIDPEKISVIPNGNDEAFFKKKMQPQQGRIIFVGRLEPQKRLDLLLEAFKIFRENVGCAEFHIVGSGPLRPELLNASRRIEGVYFHDSVPIEKRDELISMLSESWIFASASEFETYGLSISEASSVGLPVVLTRAPMNGAVNEIIKHERNGLIVDHNSPKAIADAFDRLYRNPDLWKHLSINAKKLAASYSWDTVANRVETVYEAVLRGRVPIDRSGACST
jgi:glycosyltransferase involved in cell wall biosynthesis